MKSKTCPYCDGKSYSSGVDNWKCPYCGKDITDTPTYIAEMNEELKLKYVGLYR